MKKQKTYKQEELFPELEKPEEKKKKKSGKKSLSYNTLSKIAEKRKKELLLAQIAEAKTLEEIESLEAKIAELNTAPPVPKITHKKINDLIIKPSCQEILNNSKGVEIEKD
jgi:hypothetical protein